MILVDSNVLIDVMTDDPIWYEWSSSRLKQAADNGPLLINDVIYAETSIGYPSIESAEAALGRVRVQLVSIPISALFLAGKPLYNTDARADRAPACCRTFLLAPTPQSNASRC